MREQICLAILSITALSVGVIEVAEWSTPAAPSPPPSAEFRPGAAAPAYRVSALNSRLLERNVLEVWGQTTAPDGTTIRVNLSAGGRTRRLAVAPASQGLFYARERIPRTLQNQRIRISARISG